MWDALIYACVFLRCYEWILMNLKCYLVWTINLLSLIWLVIFVILLYSTLYVLWIILWWLWITLNTSNTINDSLYLSKTSKAKSRILSTNILITCRTQKNCEPHLHLQFSRRRRPTIITRECSTNTSAEEIIYLDIQMHTVLCSTYREIVFQTGHIHCFMRTFNRIS